MGEWKCSYCLQIAREKRLINQRFLFFCQEFSPRIWLFFLAFKLLNSLRFLTGEADVFCWKCRKPCSGEILKFNEHIFHSDCLTCRGKNTNYFMFTTIIHNGTLFPLNKGLKILFPGWIQILKTPSSRERLVVFNRDLYLFILHLAKCAIFCVKIIIITPK